MKKTLIILLSLFAMLLTAACSNSESNIDNSVQANNAVSNSVNSQSNSQTQTTVYGTPEDYYNNGKELGNIIHSATSDDIILNINGREVTQLQFDICLSMIGGTDKQKAYDMLVKNQAMYQQAEALGLNVTDSELDEYVQYNYNAFINGGAQAQECFSEYCRGIGIKESEYVELMKSLPTMKETVLYQKLYQYVKDNEYSKTDKSQTFEEYFEDYAEKLVKNADIKIIKDPRK